MIKYKVCITNEIKLKEYKEYFDIKTIILMRIKELIDVDLYQIK